MLFIIFFAKIFYFQWKIYELSFSSNRIESDKRQTYKDFSSLLMLAVNKLERLALQSFSA
jgi:hypothetical protein